MLDREEYVEQAHFFQALSERVRQRAPIQDVLQAMREEALTTTKLPMAIDYMLSEVRHQGAFAPAMLQLNHYFTPFQSYLAREAEDERGRFDIRLAFDILHLEAKYRADGASSPQGIFFFEFETLCRNRLSYDKGLAAVAQDPIFDDRWRRWILTVRRQVGMIDFADMIYVDSEHRRNQQARRVKAPAEREDALFGAKEGRIAWANRRKDPLNLFSALQRQLGYPTVPRPEKIDESVCVLPNILRRLERIESRLKLLEDEQKTGIDIRQFYERK